MSSSSSSSPSSTTRKVLYKIISFSVKNPTTINEEYNEEEFHNEMNEESWKKSEFLLHSSFTAGSTGSISDTKNTSRRRHLNLMMLGCEDNSPYGPEDHTAKMFLLLICKAIRKTWNQRESNDIITTRKTVDNQQDKSNSDIKRQYEDVTDAAIEALVSITVYKAQEFDYPSTQQEWDSYDGILLPGSFSTAYEDTKHPWIRSLMDVIQREIHGFQRSSTKRRQTLGVCFGHQIFAHSFSLHRQKDRKEVNHNPQYNDEDVGGLATACPAGTQAGAIPCPTSFAGKLLLQSQQSSFDVNDNHNKINKPNSREDGLKQRDEFTLLYTHGDMVKSLPSCGVSLGGTDKVPIQAAAYFSSKEEKLTYLKERQQQCQEQEDTLPSLKNCVPSISPYAITFQAHPEYGASSLGTDVTFRNIVTVLEKHGKIRHEDQHQSLSSQQRNIVEEDSVDMMIAVGRLFGWI